MPVLTNASQSTAFPRGIAREATPLSMWGGDLLVYRSIAVLAAFALPLLAAVNWYTRGTPSWPQLAITAAILVCALVCHALSNRGRRDVAAALLIGALWSITTIYAFDSGYGMHSAVVYIYLPCVLYTGLFFGLTAASAELALTIVALILMYLAEGQGLIGGAAAFVANNTNFNFLVGVILTSIG
ncbi:MAG: hypothetical protein ACRET8_10960, partial [Burkholderiales bacterium]